MQLTCALVKTPALPQVGLGMPRGMLGRARKPLAGQPGQFNATIYPQLCAV